MPHLCERHPGEKSCTPENSSCSSVCGPTGLKGSWYCILYTLRINICLGTCGLKETEGRRRKCYCKAKGSVLTEWCSSMLNFVSFKFAFQMFCIAVLTCPNTSSFTVKVRSRISVILLSFIHCKLWWNSSSRYSKSLKSHGLIVRPEKRYDPVTTGRMISY